MFLSFAQAWFGSIIYFSKLEVNANGEKCVFYKTKYFSICIINIRFEFFNNIFAVLFKNTYFMKLKFKKIT